MKTKLLFKKRKIVSWTLIGLVSAFLLMSSVIKLMAGADAEIALNFVTWGLADWMKIIAVGELVSVILFVIPKTSSLGVLLLSAHFGGVIATHMGNGESLIIQVVILLLIWVANYFRNPEMLSSFTK